MINVLVQFQSKYKTKLIKIIENQSIALNCMQIIIMIEYQSRLTLDEIY